MRNRGLTTVTKVYIGVGVFITLVLALLVTRLVTTNMYPEQNITREDPDANFTSDGAVAPTLPPAGSSNSEMDQNHNNQTPNPPVAPSGEKSGATQ